MKTIDPIDIKTAIKNKQLEVLIAERRINGKRWIYIRDTLTGDTVKIGEVD